MHNILTKNRIFSEHKLKIQETALAAFCAQYFAPQIGLVAFKTKLI